MKPWENIYIYDSVYTKIYTFVQLYKRCSIYIWVCVFDNQNIELWEIVSDTKSCNGDGKEQILLFANLG